MERWSRKSTEVSISQVRLFKYVTAGRVCSYGVGLSRDRWRSLVLR